MAYSQTDIASAALNTLRAEGITSLSEDSVEARFTDNKWDMLVDTFLSEAEWQCAVKTEALTKRDLTSPYSALPYVYDYPSDAIQLLTVVDTSNPFHRSDEYYGRVNNPESQAYISEGDYVYYAYDSCTMSYLQTITVSSFRKYMIYPFTLFVAAELAYGIANSARYGDLLMRKYEKALAHAIEKNSQEQSNYYRVGQAIKGRAR